MSALGDSTHDYVTSTSNDLLWMDNSNSGLDGTIRYVKSGNGTASVLGLSTSGVTINGTCKIGSATLSVSNSVTYIFPSITSTLASIAGTETLTNKTITAPVLSGTVTGTYTLGGTPTITAPTITTPTMTSPALGTVASGNIAACTGFVTMVTKSGSNAGDYSTTSATLADVDSTNLAYTVNIPTGSKLLINASVNYTLNNLGETGFLKLMDGATVIQFLQLSCPVTNKSLAASLTGIVTGDGASHTLKLIYSASAATGTFTILNSSAIVPKMSFLMCPSS